MKLKFEGAGALAGGIALVAEELGIKVVRFENEVL